VDEFSLTPEERFLVRIEIRDSGCWEWTGCFTKFGYGWVNYRSLPQLTHRLAWKILVGKIPDGLCVLHACDNPPCCNPSHLWLGTRTDNAADKVRKGRQPSGDRSGARLHPESIARGEQRRHKLVASQVLDVYRRAHAGEKHSVIADEFGVSTSLISNIKRHKNWRHLFLPLTCQHLTTANEPVTVPDETTEAA
jgi:hypothetical protein